MSNNSGQNGDEGHLGTTKVPTELLLIKWLITLLTIETGGINQLFSSDHSDVNVSTPMEPGFQYKELNHNKVVCSY